MYMMTRIGAAASALALLIAVGALAARAQEAAGTPPAETAAAAEAPAVDLDSVVARVGDAAITGRDMQVATEAFAGELANVPEAQRRSVTIDALVNMHLLAQAAADAGLDQTEEFAARLELIRLQELRNAYFRDAVIDQITDEAMQAGYQAEVVETHQPQEQVHARHILLETKEEAEAVIEELKGGAAFEELAAQSKDPGSGQNGGDLGFFTRGRMVKPFDDAAFALEVGAFTEEPVETQFGWHVIKVEEKGMSAPPTFSEVEQMLRDYLIQKEAQAVLAELRDKYTVEILPKPQAAEDAGGAEEAEGGAGDAAGADDSEAAGESGN